MAVGCATNVLAAESVEAGSSVDEPTCIGSASTEAHLGLRLFGYKRFVRARVWPQERHRYLPPRLVKEISRLLIPGIRKLSARR